MSRSNIWQQLNSKKKPFLVLAPMEDVTDTVFRRIVASCGAPDLFFTEFTSAEGLLSPGRVDVSLRLRYTAQEHPLIAQIWGKTPEAYYKASKELVEMGFDGIDINMGCPVDKIVKQGACAALISNPPLASEIIKAVQEGVKGLPISVKTRVGFNSFITEEWCGFLLKHNLAALTVHGRIASELSKKPARWDEVAKVVKLRDEISPETVIVGNGDIQSYESAVEHADKFGVDGVMIGRGIFHNPWIFNSSVKLEDVTPEQLIDLLKQHLKLYKETWGEERDFNIMKKFVKMYIKGFDGAAELREKLMKTTTYEEMESLIPIA